MGRMPQLEQFNNPCFKPLEFEGFGKQALPQSLKQQIKNTLCHTSVRRLLER